MNNLSKYSRFIDFNKSQHSIYNKFKKYSIELRNANAQYRQKTAPGRPPGAREKKGWMGSDGKCLLDTYPAQNKINEKAVKFKR